MIPLLTIYSPFLTRPGKIHCRTAILLRGLLLTCTATWCESEAEMAPVNPPDHYTFKDNSNLYTFSTIYSTNTMPKNKPPSTTVIRKEVSQRYKKPNKDQALIQISSANAKNGVALKRYPSVVGLNILRATTIYCVLVYFCVVLPVILFYIATNVDLSLERINSIKISKSVLIITL